MRSPALRAVSLTQDEYVFCMLKTNKVVHPEQVAQLYRAMRRRVSKNSFLRYCFWKPTSKSSVWSSYLAVFRRASKDSDGLHNTIFIFGGDLSN